MPFKTKCPGCAKILDVPDSVVGKRVKCPACGQMWQVPAPTAAPPAAAAQPTAFGAKCPGCGKAIQVPGVGGRQAGEVPRLCGTSGKSPGRLSMPSRSRERPARRRRRLRLRR